MYKRQTFDRDCDKPLKHVDRPGGANTFKNLCTPNAVSWKKMCNQAWHCACDVMKKHPPKFTSPHAASPSLFVLVINILCQRWHQFLFIRSFELSTPIYMKCCQQESLRRCFCEHGECWKVSSVLCDIRSANETVKSTGPFSGRTRWWQFFCWQKC